MQMKENLACHPVIPTVILKYSGGLADVLVDALDAHKEEGKTGYVYKRSYKICDVKALKLILSHDFKYN